MSELPDFPEATEELRELERGPLEDEPDRDPPQEAAALERLVGRSGLADRRATVGRRQDHYSLGRVALVPRLSGRGGCNLVRQPVAVSVRKQLWHWPDNHRQHRLRRALFLSPGVAGLQELPFGPMVHGG